MDKNTRIQFSFFDALRKEYVSSFGNREWDGFARNYYHFKEKPFGVIFSWNWRVREGESLVAEILIYNENGGDKLYKYLKDNSSSPNPFEWFVMRGASRIIYEIDPDVNVGSLLTNKTYSEELLYAALGAMHLLEDEFLHLIKSYFGEYID